MRFRSAYRLGGVTLALALGFTSYAVPDQSDVDDIQNEIDKTQDEIDKTQSEIDATKDKKDRLQQAKSEMEDYLKKLNQQYSSLERRAGGGEGHRGKAVCGHEGADSVHV